MEPFAAVRFPKISSGLYLKGLIPKPRLLSDTLKLWMLETQKMRKRVFEEFNFGDQIWVFKANIDSLGANASEAPTSWDQRGWAWPKPSIRGVSDGPVIGMAVWDAENPEKSAFFQLAAEIQCVLDRLSRSQNLAVPQNQKHFFLNVWGSFASGKKF